jgi:hypothetical protein
LPRIPILRKPPVGRAAGVSKTLWELTDIVKVLEDWEAMKG